MTSVADAVEALSDAVRTSLAEISARVDAAVAAVVDDWPTQTPAQRRHALHELTRAVASLTATAQAVAKAGVPQAVAGAYLLGVRAASVAAGQPVVVSSTLQDTARALGADTYADVLTATKHVRETTKELVRVLARDHVTGKLVTGQTPDQVARALARTLAEHGVAAITYVDGARHGLADYTDMLLRTKAAEAQQAGALAQSGALGVEYMELMDGPACGLSGHDDPRKANGLILPLDEAARYPLSHPRCRRTSSPRPDVTAGTAASAAPIGPQHTAEDIERAQVQARADSAAAARARAAVARRAASASQTMPRAASAAQRRAQARVAKQAKAKA